MSIRKIRKNKFEKSHIARKPMNITADKAKKIKYLNIYGRVFGNYFKFAPVSAVFTMINCVIGGVFPAFTAFSQFFFSFTH